MVDVTKQGNTTSNCDFHNKVDSLLNKNDFALLERNHEFNKKIQDDPVKPLTCIKKFNGFAVDLADILKLNIWNRSIYSTDKIIRVNLAADLALKTKYLAKKRRMPFNMIWLIIILMGVGMAVAILILLLYYTGGI